jgi:hypothetical protein
MAGYQTHPWSSVVDFYRSHAADVPGVDALAVLAERITRSPYAAALHPVTSHFLLRLFAHERIEFSDDQIQIEHDGKTFEVRYFSAGRVHPDALTPIKSHWSTRDADGFAALGRCLQYLRWVVEERQAGSRPAV